MKTFRAILKPGTFSIGKTVYTGGLQVENVRKIPEDDLLHLERQSIVHWSDHPVVQHRLALSQWRERRRKVIDSGRSLSYFLRNNKPPKLEDIDGILVEPHFALKQSKSRKTFGIKDRK